MKAVLQYGLNSIERGVGRDGQMIDVQKISKLAINDEAISKIQHVAEAPMDSLLLRNFVDYAADSIAPLRK